MKNMVSADAKHFLHTLKTSVVTRTISVAVHIFWKSLTEIPILIYPQNEKFIASTYSITTESNDLFTHSQALLITMVLLFLGLLPH